MKAPFWILGHFGQLWRRLIAPKHRREIFADQDFVDRVLAGKYHHDLEDLAEDVVDAWHSGPGRYVGEGLPEYMGLTWKEYTAWAVGEKKIREILEERNL